MATTKDWYVRQEGKTLGPFTSDSLKLRALKGTIKQSSEVSDNPNGPWHPITKMKGLAFANVPPAVPASAAAVESPAKSLPDASGENLIWKGTQSQLVNLKTYILCGLFCWLIIPIFVAIWRYLETKSLVYEITSERLKVSWGFLSRNLEEIELYRVKDTAFFQSFAERLLGLANIQLVTSDNRTGVIKIGPIAASNAKDVRETVRKCVEHLRDKKRVREVDFT